MQRPHTSYQAKTGTNAQKTYPNQAAGLYYPNQQQQKFQFQTIQHGKSSQPRYQNYNQTIQQGSNTKASNSKMPMIIQNYKQGSESNKQIQIPKLILQDKEKLYAENYQLKLNIHQLQESNTKLNTKLLAVEKEKQKYEKLLETNSTAQNKPNDVILQIRLKKQLKEAQKKLEEKEKEIEDLQKSQKQTKIEEMQCELEIFQTQYNKLKQQFDQSIRVNEKINQMIDKQEVDQEDKTLQLNIIESLKKDNIDMANMIQECNNRYIDLQNQCKNLESQLNQSNRDKVQARKEFNELEKEYKKLKKGLSQQQFVMEQQYQMKSQQSANPPLQEENSRLKEQLDKKNKELVSLESKASKQQEKLKENDEKIKAIENKNQDLIDFEKKQNEKLRSQNEDLQQRIQQLEQQLKEQDQKKAQEPSRQSHHNVKPVTEKQGQANENATPRKQEPGNLQEQDYEENFDNDIEAEQTKKKTNYDISEGQKNEQSPQNIYAKRKLHKVNRYDVEKVTTDLKFTLILKNIKFEDLEKQLLLSEDGQFNEDNQISIMQLVEKLKSEPFNLTNESSALLIARYLVEDNQDDFIMFDVNRSNNVRMVKDVFKKLIGKYELMEKAKQDQLRFQIAEKLTSYQSMMIDSIKASILKKQKLGDGICNFEDFDQAIRYSDCNLTKSEIEFMLIQNYEYSKDTDVIYYLKVFQHFNLENINKNPAEQNKPNELQ